MNLGASRPVATQLAARTLRHNGVRIAAGLTISGVLLWLMLRRIDSGELRRSLESASLGWIGLALAFYWFELVLRTQRWRSILRPVRAFSFSQVATSLLVGYSANNVFPARLGELFRADFTGRRFRISRLSVIGTIFVERLLDMVAVIVCAAAGMLWAMGGALNPASPAVDRMLAGGLLVGVGLVGLALAFVFVMTVYSPRWVGRRFPRVRAGIGAVRAGLHSVSEPRRLSALAALSALTWLMNATATWAILNSVGISPQPATLLLLIGMSGLAAAIPSAPANLGTLQFAFVTVLATAGYSAAAAFAAASLIQVFFLGSVTIAGAAIYGTWSLRAARWSAHGPG